MPNTLSLNWHESHGMDEAQVGAIVTGPTDRAGIKDALLELLPATIGTLVLKKIDSADLIAGTTDIWDCKVTYGAFRDKEDQVPGVHEFRFNSVKRTIRRTFSISSRCYELVPGEDPEDPPTTAQTEPYDLQLIGYKGAVSPPKVEGVQVTEHLDAFSWRALVPASVATEEWRRAAGALRGSVNSTAFFGYDAGEVRMEDITGSLRGHELYAFDLSFERAPNRASITIGGIVVPDVTGWEILDIDDMAVALWPPEESESTAKKRLVPQVQRVKVHQVDPVASWSLLSALLFPE